MRHLDDELLLLYGQNAGPVTDGDLAHLESCSQCSQALEEHRRFESLLRDPAVWIGRDLRPDSDDPTVLLAAQIAEEDRQAAELIASYEDMEPARFAWLDLAADSAFHTGGVVRRLCRRAHMMCERNPLYALAIADTAVSISVALSDTLYPRQAVHELRGEAWKERTNALGYLGRFAEAFQALDVAEAEYKCLPHAGAGLVSVAFVRASLFYEREQFSTAESYADDAARAALHLGLIDLHLGARHLVALIRSDQQRHSEALEIGRELLRRSEENEDEAWIARYSSAMTALAYLKDAASHNPVIPPAVLRYVRRFIVRADRDRDLVWAPPPPGLQGLDARLD